MKPPKLKFSIFLLVVLASSSVVSAATIDPYKGRWRVDIKRTTDNFRKFAPQNIPEGGFPKAILKSIKSMSLQINRSRYIFRVGRRKVINSRFEIISLSDEGVMMRIDVKNKVREQLLILSPEGKLRILAMNNGKLEQRASANYFIWHRIIRTKKLAKPAPTKPIPIQEKK